MSAAALARRGLVYVLLEHRGVRLGLPVLLDDRRRDQQVGRRRHRQGDLRRRSVRQHRDASSPPSTCRASSGTRPSSPCVGTVLTLLVSSLAGYGFEMFRSRFRERIFAFMLLLLSIPFAALMVPLFVMISSAHLSNTFAAVHPARHRLDLHHLLLPPGDQGVPVRAARRRPRRRPQGMADLPLRLSAGDALDLCGGDHHRVHGQLEQLPLAADRAATRPTTRPSRWSSRR